MDRKTCLILCVSFLLATLAIAGESPYNPNQQPIRPVFCVLTDAPAHNTYFSGIFTGDTKNLYPIQDAFLHFAASKYGYKIVAGVDQWHMPVQCYSMENSKQLKVKKDALMQDEAPKAYKAIDTQWTFGSAKAIEEPSTPVAAAASSTQDEKIDPYNMALLQQDPRGLNLSPLDRQFVMSEAPKAKSYCAKDPELSRAVDCTCFVRTVFNYRIAHASGPIQQTNFPPLESILAKPDFTCSECVNKNQSGHVACDRGKTTH